MRHARGMTDAPRRRPDRVLIGILAAIALLVLVAVAVLVFRPSPRAYPAGSPEGTVQRYSAAVLDGDERAAIDYLSAKARARCDGSTAPYPGDIRVTLLESTVRDSTADVRVRVTVTSGDAPFGVDEYSTDAVFDLVKENGRWLIDQAPWQLTVCPETSP